MLLMDGLMRGIMISFEPASCIEVPDVAFIQHFHSRMRILQSKLEDS